MENIEATYKSSDTEEWLDKVWTRKIGYLWALFFRKFKVHPNVVTVMSMIIGACASLFFVHGSYYYEGTYGLLMNIIGVCMLAWANFYDSADGQLARMTGQKTHIGRILDGVASIFWFIPIYIIIIIRFHFHHSYEFQALGIQDTPTNVSIATVLMFLLAATSGLMGHRAPCAVADYYRQIHLFIVKGKAGSELDNSRQQKQIYDNTPWKGNIFEKLFLLSYITYTKGQEKETPNFQLLKDKVIRKYGSWDNIPDSFRKEFRTYSLPLMKWTNILTFNTRAIALYICFLADMPWMYCFFEIIVMGALYRYMVSKHEAFCLRLCNQIDSNV